MISSKLLSSEPALRACELADSAHIAPGSRGPHVGRIQVALLMLGTPVIAPNELIEQNYGSGTAAAVLAYKTARGIINRAYQTRADDIVGKMTVARLDAELCVLESTLRDRPAANFLANMRDSAPAFLLRRAAVQLMAGTAEQLPNTFGSTAGAAGAMQRTGLSAAQAGAVLSAAASGRNMSLRHAMRSAAWSSRGGTRTMLDPERGLLRERICAAARRVPIGKRFRDEGVRQCWSVVEGASKEPPSPMKENWCGILATWIWKTAGTDMKWVSKGALGGPFRGGTGTSRLATSSNMDLLAPGDILVEYWGDIHHVLVLKVSACGEKATIIEGNAVSGDQDHTVTNIRCDYNLAKLRTSGKFWFYSVDQLVLPVAAYNETGRIL